MAGYPVITCITLLCLVVSITGQSDITKPPKGLEVTTQIAPIIGNTSELQNKTNDSSKDMVPGNSNDSGTAKNSTVVSEPEIAARISAGATLLSATPRSKGLGDKCDAKVDCREEHASCLNSTCKCGPGSVTSSSGRYCLLIARKFGTNCTETRQCTEGLNQTHGPTMCLNYKCGCEIKHSLVDGRCVDHKKLFTECRTDSDCDIQGTHCKESTCTCQGSLVPHPEETSCLQLASNLNDHCEESLQCDSFVNAICKESNCVCKPLFRSNGTACVPIKALGDDCQSNSECEVQEEPGRRGCVNGLCTCIKGKQDEDVCKDGARSLGTSLFLVLASLTLVTKYI